MPLDDHRVAGLQPARDLDAVAGANPGLDLARLRGAVLEHPQLLAAELGDDRDAGDGERIGDLAHRDRHVGERARQEAAVGVGSGRSHRHGARRRVDRRLDGVDRRAALALDALDLERHRVARPVARGVALRHRELELHRIALDQRHDPRLGRQEGSLAHAPQSDDAGERRADLGLGEPHADLGELGLQRVGLGGRDLELVVRDQSLLVELGLPLRLALCQLEPGGDAIALGDSSRSSILTSRSPAATRAPSSRSMRATSPAFSLTTSIRSLATRVPGEIKRLRQRLGSDHVDAHLRRLRVRRWSAATRPGARALPAVAAGVHQLRRRQGGDGEQREGPEDGAAQARHSPMLSEQ